MSLISLEGMEFFAYHGCFEEEQMTGTQFIVDFHFESDTSEAEKTDDLELTINYQSVYTIIKKEMEQNSKLLEHVARRILQKVKERYPSIEDAEIKISKMNPPLGGKLEKVSINLSLSEIEN